MFKKIRAPDKVLIFISLMPISSLIPMFDHLLESSHQEFVEKITQVVSSEVNFTHIIWSSVQILSFNCSGSTLFEKFISVVFIYRPIDLELKELGKLVW